jgi:Tol biopolymer transport system component
MPNNNPEILDAAIELVRAGRKDEARQMLQRLIREDPKREVVWLWFVETLPDPAMRVAALRECLRHNPGSRLARDGLSLLGASVQPGGTPKPAAPAPPKLPAALQPDPFTATFPPPPASASKPEKPPKPKRGKPPSQPPAPKKPGRRGPPPKVRGPRSTPARGGSCLKRLFVVLSVLGLAILIVAVWLVSTNPGLQDGLVDVMSQYTNIGRMMQARRSGTILAVASTPTAETLPTSTVTPTATLTPTRTATPTITRTPTSTGTPTLFAGNPEDGEYQIVVQDTIGCRAFAVPISQSLEHPASDSNPDCEQAWVSPDGTQLAYIDRVDGHTIRVMNIDGTDDKEISRIKDTPGIVRIISSLAWSPDGKKVVYQASSPTNAECIGLFVIPSAGSNYPKTIKTRCLSRNLTDRMEWSPDSKWIFVFDTASTEDPTLYPFAYREEDSRAVQIALTYVGGPEARYFWSPDSLSMAYIAVVPDQNASSSIVITDLDESKGFIELKSDQYDDVSGPVWTPDGEQFLLYDPRVHKLMIIDLDGVLQGSILSLDRAPSLIRWSPDGQWLAVLEPDSNPGKGANLLIVRSDGTDLRVLAYGVDPNTLIWK